MRVVKNTEELRSLVGEELGVSDWIEISQDRINKFAEADGDLQWIHKDVERARDKGTGVRPLLAPESKCTPVSGSTSHNSAQHGVLHVPSRTDRDSARRVPCPKGRIPANGHPP